MDAKQLQDYLLTRYGKAITEMNFRELYTALDNLQDELEAEYEYQQQLYNQQLYQEEIDLRDIEIRQMEIDNGFPI